MMNWWLDKGVDGFRMDVLSLLSKEPGLPDLGPVLNGYAVYNACANGPRVHEYIQEMRRKVLNRADTITVGECCAVTLEEAKKYASAMEERSIWSSSLSTWMWTPTARTSGPTKRWIFEK